MQNFYSMVANLDPHYRQRNDEIRLKSEIEGAKLQLQDRHHYEMMDLHRQRADTEKEKLQLQREQGELNARASVEAEKIAGENARSLARQSHTHQLIQQDELHVHHLEIQARESDRDFQNRLLETRRSLLEIRADTARQKILSKQNHEQEMEKMKLESELRMREKSQEFFYQDKTDRNHHSYKIFEEKLQQKHALEKRTLDANFEKMAKHLEHVLQNYRVTYDGINDIVMRLIERFLGLGEHELSDEEMASYINEAVRSYRHASNYER